MKSDSPAVSSNESEPTNSEPKASDSNVSAVKTGRLTELGAGIFGISLFFWIISRVLRWLLLDNEMPPRDSIWFWAIAIVAFGGVSGSLMWLTGKGLDRWAQRRKSHE